jgi:hypothetical protein
VDVNGNYCEYMDSKQIEIKSRGFLVFDPKHDQHYNEREMDHILTQRSLDWIQRDFQVHIL